MILGTDEIKKKQVVKNTQVSSGKKQTDEKVRDLNQSLKGQKSLMQHERTEEMERACQAQDVTTHY